jgi:GNAT superfamily N-acetyltransferase
MIDSQQVEVRFIAPGETWPIRASVLWPEKDPGPECALDGDDDASTFHLGAICQGEVVSIGTFMKSEQPDYSGVLAYRLRAMGTSSGHQGKGCGAAVIEKALEVLSAQGVERVWCDARHVALGFYARMEWDITGSTFEVPFRGPHRRASRSF